MHLGSSGTGHEGHACVVSERVMGGMVVLLCIAWMDVTRRVQLKGESEFSISPAAGTVMEEFLFFSQWKAGS